MQPLTPHSNVCSILQVDSDDSTLLPISIWRVSAGFPSPAEGYQRDQLNATQYLVRNPLSTFYSRVRGDSMIEAGIYDGDVAVVDWSIDPVKGDVVLAVINGEFLIKYLGHNRLIAANPLYSDIVFTEGMQVEIRGKVVGTMRRL